MIAIQRPAAVLGVVMTAATAITNAAPASADDRATRHIEIHIEQTGDGAPTPRWLIAAGKFNDAETVAELATVKAPFNSGESAWRELIAARTSAWTLAMPELERPFGGVEPPALLTILIGNVGATDAFVFDDSTIAFDVSALQRVYGDATKPMNRERIDRFFAHEYTHIVHRAWRAERGLTLDSPLEQALWACLTEGLGNYRSLSARWFADDGELSVHAHDVLARLEPVLVDRLNRLATATDDEAAGLMRGLSMGPFEQKWGALPVALWLADEIAADPDALAYWIGRGHWGVLELARRHLPEGLAAGLPTRPGP